MKTIKTKNREQTAVLKASNLNINFSDLRIVVVGRLSQNKQK